MNPSDKNLLDGYLKAQMSADAFCQQRGWDRSKLTQAQAMAVAEHLLEMALQYGPPPEPVTATQIMADLARIKRLIKQRAH